MSDQPVIRFDDGAAYEKFMGVWSRKVGEQFLDWLAPEKGLSWIDIGCGNGAFTELLTERTAPRSILGVDPSDAQLKFARERHRAGVARFEQGGAESLPAADRSLDAATSGLVLFFVPDPAKGAAEMRRVTKPGGSVSAYVWDLLDGGFPLHVFHEHLIAMDLPSPLPPSAEISRMPALTALWKDAGFDEVETKVITVTREFPDFETVWQTSLSGPRLSAVNATLTDEKRSELKERVRAGLPANADGSITATARAHAVRGRAPG